MTSNASQGTLTDVAAVTATLRHVDPRLFFEHQPTSLPHPLSTPSALKLCLGLQDVFIALFLVFLILMTIFGNVLVVLSVFVYQRMRTFTNILLTSLATADLLVGLVVMPLSLLDLLHSHKWPLGRLLCGVWATTDVLLCTASILNLCVISLDRYMAITSPLKYPRTRSKKMAAGLLGCVWLLSIVICSPPWFVPGWGLFTQYSNQQGPPANGSSFFFASAAARHSFACVYSPSVPYRIYSALGSFYFPLLVMLSVYFKIFRVASAREALMRQTLGTCRLSKRVIKSQRKNNHFFNGNNSRNNPRCASAPARNRINMGTNHRINYSVRPNDSERFEQLALAHCDSIDLDDSSSADLRQVSTVSASVLGSPKEPPLPCSAPHRPRLSTIQRECHSMAELPCPNMNVRTTGHRGVERSTVPTLTKTAQLCRDRTQPQNLLAKAQDHYQTYGPGKVIRGSKEKMVYLRERKALKTIGIVVLGFVICWMPFFVLYLIEVFFEHVIHTKIFSLFSELFLWLGYSNSVLNPIIYTMYNGDFRRCFRDLLSFGCIQHHRRTMSVKKLHQQSTIF